MNQTTQDPQSTQPGKAQGSQSSDHIQALWDDLLSRKPGLVQSAYATLDASEQKVVLAHLQLMANEPDWQPEQRDSAKAAIRAITALPKQEK